MTALREYLSTAVKGKHVYAYMGYLLISLGSNKSEPTVAQT